MLRMYCGSSTFSQAFVVDDDVESLRPVGLGVDRHAATCASAALHDDRPVDGQRLADGVHQQASLQRVVVAAAAADDQRVDARLARERVRGAATSLSRGLLRRADRERHDHRQGHDGGVAEIHTGLLGRSSCSSCCGIVSESNVSVTGVAVSQRGERPSGGTIRYHPPTLATAPVDPPDHRKGDNRAPCAHSPPERNFRTIA